MVEIGRDSGEVRPGQPVAHSPDEVIHAAGMLDYDNGGEGSYSIRNVHIAAHWLAVDAHGVPSRWHSDLPL